MNDAALETVELPKAPAVGRLLEKVRPNGPAAKAMTRATREAAETAGRQARSAAAYSTGRIRAFPVASAAIALGAGFLLGALLSPRKWLG